MKHTTGRAVRGGLVCVAISGEEQIKKFETLNIMTGLNLNLIPAIVEEQRLIGRIRKTAWG